MIVDDTIIAQASAQGNSQRGIIRLSGDCSLEAVSKIFFFRTPEEEFPPTDLNSRKRASKEIFPTEVQTGVTLGWLSPWNDDAPERLVRCALFYWTKGRGFTGEQAVELHVPGAPPVLDAIVRRICETKLARLANRGEFTLRAFLGGRIDLTQAEAILGTIEAESDMALQNALAQLSGNLSRDFSVLREKLFDVLCDLEAGFDFVDEDIEFISKDEVRNRLQEALEQIQETLRRAKTRIGADQTPKVVFAGSPNVGKSSLFNKLVEYYGEGPGTAIVSNLSGTTRDYLEKELTVDGVKFILVDSAGVEDVQALVNSQPNAPRALAQNGLAQLFASASLILRCIDPNTIESEVESTIDALLPTQTPKICVATKQDDAKVSNNRYFPTSVVKDIGIDRLGHSIADSLRAKSENGEIVPSTAIRCQETLREAQEALLNALNMLDDLELRDDFLLASEIRLALERIGLVTGQVHTDDLLDRIFSKFCIGK